MPSQWEFHPRFTLESWETGKIRDTSRSTAWIDPKNRDTQTEEWKEFTILVDGKELFPNISQLAHISPVFRQLFSEYAREHEAKSVTKPFYTCLPTCIDDAIVLITMMCFVFYRNKSLKAAKGEVDRICRLFQTEPLEPDPLASQLNRNSRTRNPRLNTVK